MTSKIQNFIEENIDLIDQNTKESWEKIYDNLYKICGIAVLKAHKFVGEFTEIILNSGVEDPAEILGYIPSAFLCGAQLTTYSIPSNAISVGSSAFQSCKLLENVEMPDTVRELSSFAFDTCHNLVNIQLSSNLRQVGSFAFAGCAKLQHIQIPDSIYEIDDYSFSRCTDLSKVVVGSGLRVLEESIFYKCSNLRSLEFNDTKHEWRSIKKHRNWRKGSILECIHCLDGDVQLR